MDKQVIFYLITYNLFIFIPLQQYFESFKKQLSYELPYGFVILGKPWKHWCQYKVSGALLHFTKTSGALSVNNKRHEITLKDVLTIAEEYAIKNPKGIIEEVQELTAKWSEKAKGLEIPEKFIKTIAADFIFLIETEE